MVSWKKGLQIYLHFPSLWESLDFLLCSLAEARPSRMLEKTTKVQKTLIFWLVVMLLIQQLTTDWPNVGEGDLPYYEKWLSQISQEPQRHNHKYCAHIWLALNTFFSPVQQWVVFHYCRFPLMSRSFTAFYGSSVGCFDFHRFGGNTFHMSFVSWF